MYILISRVGRSDFKHNPLFNVNEIGLRANTDKNPPPKVYPSTCWAGKQYREGVLYMVPAALYPTKTIGGFNDQCPLH